MVRTIGVATLSLLLLVPTLVLGASLEGKLTKIDKPGKQIVVSTEKGEKTFQYSNASKGMEKVEAGDRVKIEYSEKDGKMMVNAIGKAT